MPIHAPFGVFGGFKYGGVNISNLSIVRRSICWYNFYANRFNGLGGVVSHTYIHTYTRNLANVALSIHVTLNTKPASQVLLTKAEAKAADLTSKCN